MSVNFPRLAERSGHDRWRLPLVAAVATMTILAATLAGATATSAATTAIAPGSITTTAGATGGQPVTNLAMQDLSGTTDNWNKYVEFGPSGATAYAGYRTYTLPASVVPSSVTAIAVKANYRGPATANQTWTWSLFNFTTATWTTVGTNATAPAWGAWKLLSFAGPAAAAAPSFVSTAGAVRVRLTANNATDAADLDYESITVTSGTAVADTTAPTTPTAVTVLGTPTSSSVALSWTGSSDNIAVTGYEVFQGTATTAVATVTGTTATITGLSPATAYSFTVKARDAAGNRSAASVARAATTAAATGGTSYTLPPANGKFDYQLGGSYAPLANVQIVSRDRTSVGVAGKYNVCYVNLMQTQPDESGQSTTNPPYGTTQWWRNNHLDLLLKNASGQVIIDADWNEAIFDVSTAAKRSALAAIQQPWFQGCKDSGFQAIEPDNLDAESRGLGFLTHTNIRDYLKIMVPFAHSIGLAIGQKNAVSSDEWATDGANFVTTVSPAQGFDFAVAEECQQFSECGAYTAMYGGRVYEIEYSTASWNAACTARGAQISVIDRDLNVVPFGTAGYRYSEC
jgi:hypothetical protein